MKCQHRWQDLEYGISFSHSHHMLLSEGCPLYKVLNWDMGSQRPAEGSDYPGFCQTATKSSLFPKICPLGDTCYQAMLSSFKQYKNPKPQDRHPWLELPLGFSSSKPFCFLHHRRISLPTSQCTETKPGHNLDLVAMKK